MGRQLDLVSILPREPVRFIHLGHQCPYTTWFDSQAGRLAEMLGRPLLRLDVTGRPDVASIHGAFQGAQVAVPGHSLWAAPRTAEQIMQGLSRPATVCPCPPAMPPACSEPAALTTWGLYRPGDDGWADAVAAACAVCLGEGMAAPTFTEAVSRKLAWLEDAQAANPSALCGLVIAGAIDRPLGFAELVPAAAGQIPLASPGAYDSLLTCVHARPVEGQPDPRPAMLMELCRAFARASPGRDAKGPPSHVWAVCGRASPYPNGPLPVMQAAGFAEVASLGHVVLHGRCVDELVLVSWATGPQAAEAVGVLVDARDDVVTLPTGASAGQRVTAPGLTGRLYARQDIPPGHKVAVRPLRSGQPALKYGQAIGTATVDIAAGDHVHVHNLASARAGGPLCGRSGDEVI